MGDHSLMFYPAPWVPMPVDQHSGMPLPRSPEKPDDTSVLQPQFVMKNDFPPCFPGRQAASMSPPAAGAATDDIRALYPTILSVTPRRMPSYQPSSSNQYLPEPAAFGLQQLAEHDAISPWSMADSPSPSNVPIQMPCQQDSIANHIKHDSAGRLMHSPPSACTAVHHYNASRTIGGRVTKRSGPACVNGPTSSPSSRNGGARPSKARRADKAKSSILVQPLSVLTKNSPLPMKDIEQWVNRPKEVRIKDAVTKGHIVRPLNVFMLYRSAYAERAKEWCQQTNHQYVSVIAGESWKIESQSVREQFKGWAKQEKASHEAAFPDYEYRPGKDSAGKKRNGFDVNMCENGEVLGSDSGFESDTYSPLARSACYAAISDGLSLEYESDGAKVGSSTAPLAMGYTPYSFGDDDDEQLFASFEQPATYHAIGSATPAATRYTRSPTVQGTSSYGSAAFMIDVYQAQRRYDAQIRKELEFVDPGSTIRSSNALSYDGSVDDGQFDIDYSNPFVMQQCPSLGLPWSDEPDKP